MPIENKDFTGKKISNRSVKLFGIFHRRRWNKFHANSKTKDECASSVSNTFMYQDSSREKTKNSTVAVTADS